MKEFCMHEIKKEMRYKKLTPGFSNPWQTSFDESRTQKNDKIPNDPCTLTTFMKK